MEIQRLYEPNPEALDRVAEILYRLLVEPPGSPVDGGEPASAKAETSTCFSREREG